MDQETEQHRQFVPRRALSWLGLVLLALALIALIWYGGKILLLVFAGILFGVVLRAPMGFLIRRAGMPEKLAYALVLILLLGLMVGFGMLVGPGVLNQAGQFSERVPTIIENARDYLESRSWGRWLVDGLGMGGGGENAAVGQATGGDAGQAAQADQARAAQAGVSAGQAAQAGADAGQGAGGGQPAESPASGQTGQGGGATIGGVASRITVITRTVTVTLAHTALVLVLGLFLAFDPALYRRGLVRLFPAEAQQRAAEVVDELGRTLKYWLVGQLALMTITGVLTGIGLVILGIPLALALAFFVFLMDFIPFIGPILGFIPIVMMAATQGGSTILWALVLYLAIQQIEGNFLTPLIQERVMAIPPALTVSAVFLGGALFGVLGAILGTPLMAVIFVLVKMLYVHDELGQRVEVPGKTEPA